MKSQIQNNNINNNNNNNNDNNNNGGIVELLIFPKKASHEGTKTILYKKIMGKLFWIGRLMIRLCQGLGGVS